MTEKKKEEFGFDPANVGDEVLQFMKSSFDATFDNMVKIQDLNEKMLKEMIEKGEAVQQDAEKKMNEFMEKAKQERDQYRKVMEDGFKKMESMFKTEK
jgi:polyhydroxyalkanoate synthesis regulator phasin